MPFLPVVNFRFRTKLILAIFPVVAGITTGVLLIAEKKFNDAQQQLFEEQFEGQIGALIKSRQERSESLAEDLAALAGSPELLKAIENGEAQAAWSVLAPPLERMALEAIARPGLLQGMKAGVTKEPGRGGLALALKPGERARGDADRRETKSGRLPAAFQPFIGMVDPDGNFLKLQRPKTPGNADESEFESSLRRRSGRLQWLADRKLEQVLKSQEIGYLLVEAGEGKPPQVREIFVTPIHDPDTGKFYGAFTFGLPLPTLEERVLFEQSKHSDLGRIMSGIWLEDTLVSSTIPDQQRADVAAIVKRELEQSRKPGRELTVSIDDARHRIIYRVLNPGSPFPTAAQVSLYSLAVLDRQVADLRQIVVGIGLAALAVAMGLALLVSRGLSGPIQQLVRGTSEIERGNYDVRVDVRSHDEIGTLAQSFNQMAHGLALQERYRSVLNAVADRTVAQELIVNSHALGGELREVSVLFCDIRGFTALTEGMPPAEVIEMLNEHMTALTEVAYRHRGIVDKFVGDLLMVVFGAPRSSGRDAYQAVRCAWDMLETRRRLNHSCRHPLEIGIGVATGTVVAGCMGSEQRLSYTVLGERVNLASRLCGAAQAGEILLDQATLDRLPAAAVEVESRAPIALKGFRDSVPCHRLVGIPSEANGAMVANS